MEPEPGEGLDAFLRRAAQVAAFGAAVGAAVGAARAARSGQSEQAEATATEPQERPEGRQPEPPEEDEREEEELEERPQQSAQEQEAPETESEAREATAEEQRGESVDGQVGGEAASVIRRALPQLEQLTGRAPEGVLGLQRDDEGWRLTVEVVELPRVPSSTDVLATYDVVLDGDGDVREYHRSGRYVRGRGDLGQQ
jgi:hypothetical protein